MEYSNKAIKRDIGWCIETLDTCYMNGFESQKDMYKVEVVIECLNDIYKDMEVSETIKLL